MEFTKMEEWKAVVGYEGLYEVSNRGQVRSLDRVVPTRKGKRFCKGKLLKSTKSKGKSGKYYMTVALSNGAEKTPKTYWVHRLVAKAFIPNPDNLTDVNHIDENPSNNCVDNLEWLSHKDNMNYGTLIKRVKETKERNKKQRDIEMVNTGIQYCKEFLIATGNEHLLSDLAIYVKERNDDLWQDQ